MDPYWTFFCGLGKIMLSDRLHINDTRYGTCIIKIFKISIFFQKLSLNLWYNSVVKILVFLTDPDPRVSSSEIPYGSRIKSPVNHGSNGIRNTGCRFRSLCQYMKFERNCFAVPSFFFQSNCERSFPSTIFEGLLHTVPSNVCLPDVKTKKDFSSLVLFFPLIKFTC